MKTRWFRPLTLAPLTLALTIGLAPTPAPAQEPAAEGGESEGSGVGGYMVTGIFAAAVLAAVCISSNRKEIQ